jgi:hypothetical protein
VSKKKNKKKKKQFFFSSLSFIFFFLFFFFSLFQLTTHCAKTNVSNGTSSKKHHVPASFKSTQIALVVDVIVDTINRIVAVNNVVIVENLCIDCKIDFLKKKKEERFFFLLFHCCDIYLKSINFAFVDLLLFLFFFFFFC